MNKLLRSLSALLAALLLISCTQTPAVTTADTTADGAKVTTVNTTTTATDAPVTTPDPTPSTDPTPAEPVTYPTYAGNEAIELLTSFENLPGEVRNLSQQGDKLLLNYGVWDEEGMMYAATYAVMLDLITGERSEAVLLPGTDSTATLLESGNICLIDASSCSAKVYDPAGKKLFEYTYKGEGGLHLIPDGNGTLWCYDWYTPVLTRVRLDGSEVETYTVPDSHTGYIMGHRGSTVYYSAWDTEARFVYAVSEDGEFTHLKNIGNNYNWGEGCFFTDHTPNLLVDPADPNYFLQLHADLHFSWVMAGCGTRLLTAISHVDDDGNERTDCRVIDYRNKIAYPALEFSLGQWMNSYIFGSDGLIYFVVRDTDEEIPTLYVCRWNYMEDPEEIGVERLAFNSLEEKVNEVAARIFKKWGVQVYYQPEKLPQVASDYSAAAITDYRLLYEHILQAENALSAYPDGFFDDLYYGDYTHLELYLCGKFTPLTAEGITTAEALSNTRGTAMVIAFNVEMLDGEYVRVLAHELLHIMERRIDQIDADALGEWITLTPGGHDAYYYSYHDAYGDEMNDDSNTYYFEPDPADAYFVDAYSKSFPTEDRARIFEKLMESGGNPYFADSPVLMAKARTLCRIIREYFPSVAALERASWEVE
ncbi:MAG: hypothetical protein ACI3YH_04810 [Eubacteriales bacterium]